MKELADIGLLRTRLTSPLPGEAAQMMMSPRQRQRVEVNTLRADQFRPSAVLILICEDQDGELFIPLIERNAYNGAHSAQISLPGGKAEDKDENLSKTALRECFEEIGITDIHLLGPLTSLYIPVSSFLVHPFVGYCAVKNPVFQLHEREVKSLVKFPLKMLMDEKTIESGQIELFNNLKIETSWYMVDGHRIWGATAMILSELREVLRSIS